MHEDQIYRRCRKCDLTLLLPAAVDGGRQIPKSIVPKGVEAHEPA